jgi:tetratricopeptide (TPR) repeat protein
MDNTKNNTKAVLIIVIILVVAGLGFWMIPNTVLSVDRMLAKGEMYQKMGKTARALEIYRKAAANYPNNPDVHLRLGQALLEADEPEKAREEFDKAVKLSKNSDGSYDAQISMASMLLADKEFAKAEKILLEVKDPKPEKVKLKLAQVYLKWGDDLYSPVTRLDAVDKYRLAFKNFEDIDVEAQQKVEDRVIKIYTDIAKEYISENKIDQATTILKQSLDFVDNPTAHINLAEIYRKQNKRDEAIAEFEKAYEVDTTGTAALYLSELLVEKGIELAKKADMEQAKEQFEKAQEVNPSIVIPAEILYSLALEGIKTKLVPNTITDRVYPGIVFKVKNEGKEKINFLKAKVLFYEEGKVIGKAEKVIASKKDPLEVKKSTGTISLTSETGVKDVKKQHVLQAKIYLAYDSQSDWKFARALTLTREKTMFASSDDTKKSVKKANATMKPAKHADASLMNQKPVVTTSSTSSTTTTASSNSVVPEANTASSNVPVPQAMPQPVPVPVPITVQSTSSSNVELPPMEN